MYSLARLPLITSTNEPPMSASVHHLPPPTHNLPGYSIGFDDGMRVGARSADERYFWMGVAAGVVMAAVIVVAVHTLGGSL